MLARLLARWRSLWAGLRRRADLERDMDDEFRFHLEARAADLVRAGLPAAEAARRARIEFGNRDHFKDEGRASRGLRRFDDLRASWLDVKLGLRMLARYPGLTVVGGLGLAVAIALGVLAFDVTQAVTARLPLDDGDRIVAIESWDTRWNDRERRILHDFVAWRDQLTTVRDLGAFRTITRNLMPASGPAEPVGVAEMTASGFTVARVPPLLGRSLIPDDERAGAAPVAVLGYDVWRTRFGSDTTVVGRSIRLGGTVHTVVGVMPEGFAFPVNHSLWVPLRADPADYVRRGGPALYVFGRLAGGATLASAQAEVETHGERAAAAFPDTHGRLRPRVVRYRLQFLDDGDGWALGAVQLLGVLLLGVVAANVAILVYARTATRQTEIAVRTALGASRGRVVGQLFVEALVLTGAAAAVALGAVRLVYAGADQLLSLWRDRPFWFDVGLSSSTLVYTLVLVAAGAVLVGIVPGIQATGRRVQSGLARLGTGSSLRFGGTWNALVVAQVACSVAVLPPALWFGWTYARHGLADPGFAADEFLTARLVLDRDIPPTAEADAYDQALQARYTTWQAELLRRLAVEPRVARVTLLEGVPGLEPQARIEVEGEPPGTGGERGSVVGTRRIAMDYFDVFGVPILAGRPFSPGDIRAAATVRLRDGDGDGIAEIRADDLSGTTSAVVVSRSFVRDVLRGGNALGRRVRSTSERTGEPGPWYEIVGVVEDFPARPMEPDAVAARLYHPAAPGEIFERLAVRVRGSAAAFAPRLRQLVTELDPSLRLTSVQTLDRVLREEQSAMRLGALAIGLVTLSVLLLSVAGIYALMSFTVAQRRREIGVRIALGAQPRRILSGVFARALRQLAAGVIVGLVIAGGLDLATRGGLTGGRAMLLLPAVAAFMVTVGLLATLGPARRGLRIQPTEALRSD